jgi:hypothetical protein
MHNEACLLGCHQQPETSSLKIHIGPVCDGTLALGAADSRCSVEIEADT